MAGETGLEPLARVERCYHRNILSNETISEISNNMINDSIHESIIQIMKNLSRIYHFTQIVDKENKTRAADEWEQAAEKVFGMPSYVGVEEAIAVYMETETVTEAEAKLVYKSALKGGYLQTVGPGSSLESEWQLEVEPIKGRKILESSFRIPYGLIDEVLTHYKATTLIVLTVISAAVLGNIVDIIKWFVG